MDASNGATNGPRRNMEVRVKSILSLSVSGLAVAVAFSTLDVPKASAADQITIVSWGGAYQESQRKAYYEPYAKEKGIKVVEEEYDGELGKVKAMKEAGNVTWDVLDVDSAHALAGCDEGLLEKLDYAKIGGKAKFLPGTALDCAVGTIAYSTIFAFNADVYKDNQPSTLMDLFDTAKYPGKRALLKKPFGNLEWALIADGVPGDKVYEVLSTPEGVDQAFKKLDSIKKDIVWWEAGAQPPELLANGEVVMTSAWNGRIGNAIKEGKNFKIVWDYQEFDWDFWTIPAGTKNIDRAYDFIKFASDPKNMAQQSKYIAYAPTHSDAIALVDPAIAPTLPTFPDNMKTAIPTDLVFWADNNEELTKRFNAWLAQ
jgi:putative spermidine/putrescine transport system substrate-binding protein